MVYEVLWVNLHSRVHLLFFERVVVLVLVTFVQNQVNLWIRILYREITRLQLLRCRIHSRLEPTCSALTANKRLIKWIAESTENFQCVLCVILAVPGKAPEISGDICAIAGKTRQRKLFGRAAKASERILVLFVKVTERRRYYKFSFCV